MRRQYGAILAADFKTFLHLRTNMRLRNTDAPMRIGRNIIGEAISASNDGKFHKSATAI